MKLKALSMQGFKSFADKTQIDFMPGITGVVGPNGSGKSNIIEAIRWVMGEQSAKGLRGDKMADVIFGGTKNRAPLNRAEVSIVFDNQDHYLNSEFSEIEIKRTLYRNGESKYQLNGKQVRLKDIQELFMDSGLGHESFSIISQGRVEHIFSAKPEDRRAIIEDVAGVYKYKQNKTQASKKLATVQDNLARVTDIIYELEQRLEPLAQQSAQAMDYQNQKAEYDQLNQTRLQLVLTLGHAQLHELTQNLTEQQQALSEATAQLNAAQTQLAEQKETLQAQRAQQQQQQQALLQATQAVENIAGELKVQKEREHNQAQLVQTTEQTLAERENAEQTLQAGLAHAQAELKQAQQTVVDLAEQIKQLDHVEERDTLATLQENLAKLRADSVDALQALTTAKNHQQYAQQESKRADAQTQRYQERADALAQQAQQAQVQLEQAQDQAKQAKTELAQAQQVLAEQQKQGQQAEQTYQESRKAWYQELQTQQEVQARLQSLQRLNEQYDGYYQGVKNLMRHQSDFPGIQGVVTELITVAPEHQLAIETALGSALQQVVVDQPDTAKQAIRFLSERHLGRVTFLPLSTIKARQLPQDVLQTAQQQVGYLGTAADLVHIEPSQVIVKQHLLNTTLVVDNLDHATQLAKAIRQRARIVTLDGQVINAGGAMTGGASRNQQQGLLSQKNEMAELNTRLTELNQSVADMEAKVAKQQTQLNELTEAFKAKQNEVMQLSQADQDQRAEVELAQQRLAQVEQNQKSLAYDMQAAGIQTETTHQDPQLEVQQAQAAYDEANANLAAAQAKIEELQQRLEASDAQLLDVRLAHQTAENNVEHLQQTVANQQQQLQDNQDAQKQLQQQLTDLKTNQVDVKARLATEYEAKQAERDDLEASGGALTQAVEALTQNIEQIEQAVTNYQDRAQQLQQHVNQTQMKKDQLASQIEQTQVQLSEDYHATYEPQKEASEEQVQTLNGRLKLLKRGLDEIGAVNLNAIAEYEEVKQRYDFLQQQKQDLIDSQDDLTETMSEMDEEVKTRFKTTFDAVNAQFEQIFVKMFGGGQAKLYLSQPDDLLETGIDIKAQPPGKKFQQMSLLSGGEKALTAISLLFAILAVRPVPFVVLDETEAALDEANVDRFANYLHEANQRTQFIVITHRQGTMAACDVLYGVTMQEPGVSTMVSVNLNEAVNERG
ncbi:chromosome segregation protein [Weissella uvarum]|uniref:chromosome segregation protein SMC n=1 Tax=Weissella uvarum TaxID=1479233 RepID=UPI00195FB61B|nr:chromosome segregation protein SMC [Weissella uvarum]MBM7617754.1 chromosome segregation protein [Weissella uvarum]MCM0595867.1 chromosome segregation protein SMC [Weissella uvarum]